MKAIEIYKVYGIALGIASLTSMVIIFINLIIHRNVMVVEDFLNPIELVMGIAAIPAIILVLLDYLHN